MLLVIKMITPPEVIAKAPNYMKYNVLSQLAYEAWIMGRKYYETY